MQLGGVEGFILDLRSTSPARICYFYTGTFDISNIFLNFCYFFKYKNNSKIDNPGGLVRAGLDIAALWLDGSQPVFNVTGREEAGVASVMQVWLEPIFWLFHTFLK